MKIWLTYENAGSLHGGGLERVYVWFSQPVYTFIKTTRDWEDEDLPFGQENGQREGVQRHGWRCLDGERGEMNSLSFGKVFGYGDGFPMEVWKKLEEHFGSTNLREWSTIEEQKKVRTENFLLEVEFDIDVKSIRAMKKQ